MHRVSTDRRRGVALVVLTAVAVGYLNADYAPLIPLLSTDLGLDDLRAGLLATGLSIVYLIGTLLTTGLADRVGPKPIIALGLGVAALGAATFGASPGFPVALLAKGIEGLGTALTFVAGARYIAGLYGASRSHVALGLYGGGYPLGGAIALALMPALAQLFASWRPAFLVEGALMVIVLALWLTTPAVASVRRSGSIRDALRCGNCWLAGLQHVGFGLVAASGTWIALFLVRDFGLTLVASGVLGALLLIVTTVARPIGGWLVASRRVRTRLVMGLSNVLLIAGVIVLALPGRPLLAALVGAAVLGIGGGLPYAAVFNTAAASVPRAPAAGQGMPVMIGSLTILTVAPAMGYAVQQYGFSAAWTLVGAAAFLALLGSAVMRGEEELAALSLR
ncbi:MAG: MFS transporter [Chloroflexota bacterium]|nr:MFS transporter [Chloroflexota bacterium]